MSQERRQNSQYKSARMSPNTTTLESQDASSRAREMMLAWDYGAVEDLSSLAQALKGQQSEY